MFRLPDAAAGSLAQQAPVLLAGLVISGGFVALSAASRGYGDVGLVALLGVALPATAVLLFTAWWVRQRRLAISPWLIVVLALLGRAAAGAGFPLLEDDFYRYLWDGRTLVEDGSPYGLPPAHWFGNTDLSAAWEAVLDAINYPQVATVYGPAAQWLFGIAYWLSGDDVRGLQVLAGLADLLIVLLLLYRVDPGRVLLYALSPLVLKEYANSAHIDAFGVLFLVLAWFAMHCRRAAIAGICGALALGTKPFALLMLPFLFRRDLRAWLSLLLMCALIAWPFGLRAAWFPDGLAVMGRDWLFNAPLYALAAEIGGSEGVWWLRRALPLAFVLLWCTAVWRVLRLREDGPALPPAWMWPAFLLTLPVCNPWYLVWWLPWVLLRPADRAPRWEGPLAWAASALLWLAYCTGINLPGSVALAAYEAPAWALLVQWLPLLLLPPVLAVTHRRSSRLVPPTPG